MSDQWIKMRKSLLTDPRVVRIMSALRADRFRTVGGLFAAWCLFDEQTVDGKLAGYSPEVLDDIVGFPGLARAMEAVGWLVIGDDFVEAVAFSQHNGQSAKRRAQENVRKMSARSPQNVRIECGRNADKKRPREEKSKRREDIQEQEPPLSPKGESAGGEPSASKTSKQTYSTDFENFWLAFPKSKRKSKGAAWAAWRKAIKQTDASTLIAKASEYALSDVGRTHFAHQPAVWLNQACWEDDPEAWRRSEDGCEEPAEREPPQRVVIAEVERQRVIEMRKRTGKAF